MARSAKERGRRHRELQLDILTRREAFCRRHAPIMLVGGIGCLLLSGVLIFVLPAGVLQAVFGIVFGVAGFASVGRSIALFGEKGRLARQIPQLVERLEEDVAAGDDVPPPLPRR